jgi:hypothetical protein
MLVEVSGQRFVFPQQCACCGGSPNTTLQAAHSKSWGKRVVHTKTWRWDFPYCSSCLDHVRSWSYASAMALLYAAAVVVLTLIVSGSGSWSDGAKGIGFMVCIVLSIVAGTFGYVRQQGKARGKCSETCASPGRAVEYVNWYGTVHSFNVVSSRYAALFMLGNAKKLINLTEDGRRLMEWGAMQLTPSVPSDHSNIHITVSATTASGKPSPPKNGNDADDEKLVRCLAKLESLKGTASKTSCS